MDYTEDSLPGKEASHNEGSSSEEQQKFLEALEELKIWKRKVEEAESKKSRLLIEKLDSEESKKQAQKEVQALTKEDTSLEMKEAQENNILDLEKSNRALLDHLKKRETILKNKKAECATLEQKLKINAEIPEKKVVFTRVEKETGKENYDSIVSVFSVTQRPLFLLKGCQALITFEKEEVAEQILRQANCPVIFDTKKINVKPNHVTLEPLRSEWRATNTLFWIITPGEYRATNKHISPPFGSYHGQQTGRPTNTVVQSSGGGGIWALLGTLFCPLLTVWRFISNFIFGSAPPPGTSPRAPPHGPGPASASSSEPKRETIRKRVVEKRQEDFKRDGKICRLRTQEDSEDENNTWNGNSTQQM